VREGFISTKVARDQQRDMEKRYQANLRIKEEIVSALGESDVTSLVRAEALRNADVRRHQAIQRQSSKCLYCGTPIDFTTAQMDHIVPRKGVGSTNTLDNLVAVCAACNKDKSKKLFSVWAAQVPGRQKEAIERVEGFIRDSYFRSNKQFRAYQKDVIARLKQTEEDEPLDARSIESVAWMARELREQIQGHFGYLGKTALNTPGIDEEYCVQRVNVFKGSVTASARRATGLEGRLPWAGGSSQKTRLDRRHHAIDASVIALMRPAVAKVLIERDALRSEQFDSGISREQAEALGPRYWKHWRGSADDSEIYTQWAGEQMSFLEKMLSSAMEQGRIVVTNPIRLRLGRGRAHEDTVRPLIKRHVGDALSSVNIDKAESPALWMALTSHPDYDPSDEPALPADFSRRIRVHDRWLDANDEIGFMANDEKEFHVVKDAVFSKVRGGFAAIGATIHHARFYRIPKINKAGKQTGWLFAYMRVFQEDLLRARKEDLFLVEIPPQAISRRSSIPALRSALDEGTAEYLGWAVVGDEVHINPEDEYFSPEGTSAINKFMKAFPDTRRFTVVGFGMNSKITLKPIGLSAEMLPDMIVTADESDDSLAAKSENKKRLYGDNDWLNEDIRAINTVLGLGGSFHPSVDAFCRTLPTFIHRDALGRIRYRSNNNMPVTWKVTPHPFL
jgi:CRISPR-associated endonuclease Csn1